MTNWILILVVYSSIAQHNVISIEGFSEQGCTIAAKKFSSQPRSHATCVEKK